MQLDYNENFTFDQAVFELIAVERLMQRYFDRTPLAIR